MVVAFFAFCDGGGFTGRLLFAEAEAPVYPKYLAQIIILILSPNIAQAYMYKLTSCLIDWIDIDETSWFKRHGPAMPYYFILIDFICLVMQGIIYQEEVDIPLYWYCKKEL